MNNFRFANVHLQLVMFTPNIYFVHFIIFVVQLQQNHFYMVYGCLNKKLKIDVPFSCVQFLSAIELNTG